MPRRALVHRISASAPDDVSGIEAAITGGRIDPKGVVAVLAKTEGNGLVNDFSRGHATLTLSLLFRRHLPAEEAARICLVMSGGTEGGMAPHWLVFERAAGEVRGGAALAIGSAHTPPLPFEHLGRLAQVDQVAAGVRAAMDDAGIGDPDDVHFVQVKCPLLVAQRLAEADRRGAAFATRDTLKSMGLSRAASALGVAVALGEMERDGISDVDIGANWALWSARASASAGIELVNHEIVVMGMSSAWCGPLAIEHAVMADAIDVEPVRASALPLPGSLRRSSARGSSRCSARRRRATTAGCAAIATLDDSDIAATRHARAFVCGALAGLVGHAELYVSGGAEHQGPDGGGPVALIVDRASS